MNHFKTLCIGSGGFKGIGMLSLLNKKYGQHLENIENYIGSSIGAFLCFFLSLGLSPDELLLLVCTQDCFSIFNHRDVFRKLMNIIADDDFLKLTFSDLYKLTNKTLVVTTLTAPLSSSLMDFDTNYYSHVNRGDKIVIDAICESMHILPTEHEIDGGYGDNFPFSYAKKHLVSPILGVYTIDKTGTRYLNIQTKYFDNLIKVLNFMEMYVLHMQLRLIEYEKNHADEHDKIDCFINRKSIMRFQMRSHEIAELYNNS